MAQQVEHVLGKDEVPGSNPGISSKKKKGTHRVPFFFRSLVKGFNAPLGAVRGGVSHQGSVATAFPGISRYSQSAFLFFRSLVKGFNAPSGAVRGGASHQGSAANALPGIGSKRTVLLYYDKFFRNITAKSLTTAFFSCIMHPKRRWQCDESITI